MFSLDHLNIDSELDLFEAAVRYAKAQDKRPAERSVSPAADCGPSSEKRIKSPEPSTSKVRIFLYTLIIHMLIIQTKQCFLTGLLDITIKQLKQSYHAYITESLPSGSQVRQ